MTELTADLYINRELSWLEFNQRVLDEAKDPSQPLLERVKFLAIVSSNLDEFFEIRVGGLKQQDEADGDFRNPDGLTPRQQLARISARAHQMVDEQYLLWQEQLCPALRAEGLHFLTLKDLSAADKAWAERFFDEQVAPVLTPMAIDPAHPFPQLPNKSINLALVLLQKDLATGESVERLGLVPVPQAMPRFITLPEEAGKRARKEPRYIFLADLMRFCVGRLFPGRECAGAWGFRITRNSNLYLDEDEAENILDSLEAELKRRKKGAAVRLEAHKGMPLFALGSLMLALGLEREDVYEVDGPVNLHRLMALTQQIDRPDLKDLPLQPRVLELPTTGHDALFDLIREGDLLLHHPYESFGTVTDFITRAAEDPKVLAIKQTFYRTSGDSPIVRALIQAAEKGKQVTVLMELKARFDEENNIHWAREMEEAGIHVVYGLVGYKTHCKLALVVRREGDGLRRYAHLGTGNYNQTTARIYTDLGLFTCRESIGRDVAAVFNLLTGFTGPDAVPQMESLLVAPLGLKEGILSRLAREEQNAREGKPARVVAKMNALVDPEVIAGLYQASQAGVAIDLIVRGICCLKPGLPGLSENIRVRSIVDRFLEHSRVYYFENSGQPEVWAGSADWMPRNFQRRVEVLYPILDEAHRRRVISDVLAAGLNDSAKARVMRADGSWARCEKPGAEAALRSQSLLMAAAASHSQPGLELPPFAPLRREAP